MPSVSTSSRRKPLAEEIGEGGVVHAHRLVERVAAGVGDHGVRDARVRRARGLVHVPEFLEPVEEAGDPGGREEQPAGEIDPSHAAFLLPGEHQEGLVVAHREAVRLEQAHLELASQRRVRAEQPHEEGDLGRSLRGQ